MTEMTERLRIIGVKISVLSVLSVMKIDFRSFRDVRYFRCFRDEVCYRSFRGTKPQSVWVNNVPQK